MSRIAHIREKIRNLYTYRHEPEHLRLFADHYWRALELFIAFVFLLIVVYGAIEYIRISSAMEEVHSAEVSASVPAISRTQLQKALDEFRSREARFELLQNTPPNF